MAAKTSYAATAAAVVTIALPAKELATQNACESELKTTKQAIHFFSSSPFLALSISFALYSQSYSLK